ncbi:MAG: UDP-3-O-(3-hydroxymyristoyl)glucosamine N-acyltransferase, partial [Gammaproteobacteria bacterium]|nr:UDP-3-O-(3-hydroxymyristoyl)glucosamine N-acyltransferase [Gammaproteobacteria bacterium]
MSLRLGAIVETLGGDLHGDPAMQIERLAPLATAKPDALSFLGNLKLRKDFSESRAGCVIVSPEAQELAAERGAYIVAPDPSLYFARVTQLWKRAHAAPDEPHVHPSAVVHPDAFVDPEARIGPLCVVERGARIGASTVLKSRVTVSE